jgi:hypothetical protein
MIAVIALRFYARFTAKPGNWFGAMGLDDALVGLSWIVLLLTQVFIQIAANHGNGKHFDDLSHDDQIQAMKWNTIIDAVIIWAFSLPKLAIIALLRRILNFGKSSLPFQTVLPKPLLTTNVRLTHVCSSVGPCIRRPGFDLLHVSFPLHPVRPCCEELGYGPAWHLLATWYDDRPRVFCFVVLGLPRSFPRHIPRAVHHAVEYASEDTPSC